MHKNILLLTKKGFSPMYTDTDSLVFSGPKSEQIPFKLNGGLGYFKKEFSDINGFCCIGKKSYIVRTEGNNFLTKVCGLSFQSPKAQDAASFQDFEELLNRNVPINSIPQVRIKRSKTSFTRKVIKNINIPHKLNYNRNLKKDGNYMHTVPYGFQKE